MTVYADQFNEVDLKPAFAWTCRCGLEQFVHTVAAETPEEALVVQALFPRLDPKRLQPEAVKCEACGREFTTKLFHPWDVP